MSPVNPVSLPNHATLDRMRREAKLLQRAVRAGEPEALRLLTRHGSAADAGPDFQLTRAQLVVARAHGFASWPRLKRYFDTAADLRFEPAPAQDGETAGDRFLRLACLGYTPDDGSDRWTAARALLAEHPGLSAQDVWVAAAAGDDVTVTERLTADPGLARRRGGVFRWTPLYYVGYSRVADPTVAEAIARRLLAAGADPNEGYLWAGQPTPFTLFTGALGSGEMGSVRQPALPVSFARMLLEAGADPNDGQALYNRQFEPDDEPPPTAVRVRPGRGRRRPVAAVARRRAGRPGRPAPRSAVLGGRPRHDRSGRAAHRTSQCRPDRPDRHGHRPVEAALLSGNQQIAEMLLAAGAPAPVLSPADRLIAAVMAGDRPTADQVAADHPGAHADALRFRPGLPVWAASRGRSRAVALALDLGWVARRARPRRHPVEQPWQTALHEAAGNGSREIVRLLLASGADRTIRDRRFDVTAADWAAHFDHSDIADLIDELRSRDVGARALPQLRRIANDLPSTPVTSGLLCLE